MLRIIKPKNARSARALKKREPKVEEDSKAVLFIRGSQTSQIVNDALVDLYRLKKPDAIMFSKRNAVRPFEDPTSLEFFSQKNDASLFVVGTHSKKRPHNLVFVRMFDHQVLDMIELGIEKATAMAELKTRKCAVGMKPLLLFNGNLFDTSDVHRRLKNMLLDFFRGQTLQHVTLKGLEHVISVTTNAANGKVHFRVYTIQMMKSGQRTPRVELEEMGPSFDLCIRRTQFAKDEVYKIATKVPKELKPKKIKNVDVNEIGDKVGRIHLGRQDLSKMQTRKMKGLKRDLPDEEGAGDEPAEEKPRDSNRKKRQKMSTE